MKLILIRFTAQEAWVFRITLIVVLGQIQLAQ